MGHIFSNTFFILLLFFIKVQLQSIYFVLSRRKCHSVLEGAGSPLICFNQLNVQLVLDEKLQAYPIERDLSGSASAQLTSCIIG